MRSRCIRWRAAECCRHVYPLSNSHPLALAAMYLNASLPRQLALERMWRRRRGEMAARLVESIQTLTLAALAVALLRVSDLPLTLA